MMWLAAIGGGVGLFAFLILPAYFRAKKYRDPESSFISYLLMALFVTCIFFVHATLVSK